MRVLTVAVAGLCLLSGRALAEDLNVDVVRKEALGKWERFTEIGGQTYRLVKDVSEKEESLTAYSLTGEATYQHTVKYEITVENELAIFTYWDFTVTISEPSPNAPAKDVRTRYLFKIKNGKWYQTSGMFAEAKGNPQFQVWTRPKMPAEAIKEMSYFVGNWSTKGRVGDVRSNGYWNTKWAPTYQCLTIENGSQSVGQERGGQAVGLMGWDDNKKKIVMHSFWSYNENYTLHWTIKSDTEWEGELVGVEEGAEFTTKIKLLKKGPNEFIYMSKNVNGDEVEVALTK